MLIEFDLCLVKGKYTYNSNLSSNFINVADKYKIIACIEQQVNKWIDQNPIEKYKIESQIIDQSIKNSMEKIASFESHIKQTVDEGQSLIDAERKNIEEYRSQLKLIENKILEAERNSLQNK
jgi:vacuolar-type H+-ATPase subunit I/STV1